VSYGTIGSLILGVGELNGGGVTEDVPLPLIEEPVLPGLFAVHPSTSKVDVYVRRERLDMRVPAENRTIRLARRN
jgi:hypothetical protein